MTAPRTLALSAVALLLAVTFSGCFETTLNLGRSEDAKVDPAMCGTWEFSWADGDNKGSAEASVLNFDGRQFYVQWNQQGEKPLHLRAFLVPVKDATFAQATPLAADLEDKHLIVRVEIKGSKLMLRHLKEEFFGGINTDAQLRSKIEENLNNDQMYEGPWLAGSQIEKPAS